MARQSARKSSSSTGKWGRPDPATDIMARGLGVFSLALGAMEITGARALAQMLGMKGQENFIRLCGAREIIQGAAILASRNPTMAIYARIAGDALDIGMLAREFRGEQPKKLSLGMALASVLGITAMDVYNARALNRDTKKNASPPIDFSKRSGLPAITGRRHGRARGPLGLSRTSWSGSGSARRQRSA